MIQPTKYRLYVEYTLNHRMHRPNGPAIIWYDGHWSWWLYDNRHRYYGPRMANDNEWCIHGKVVK